MRPIGFQASAGKDSTSSHRSPPKPEGTSPDPKERATQEKAAREDLKTPEGELKGKAFNPFDRKSWTLKGAIAWALKEGSEATLETVILKNLTDIFKKKTKAGAEKLPSLKDLLGEDTSDEYALVLAQLDTADRDFISQWFRTLGTHQQLHFQDNIVHMAFRKNDENDPIFGTKGFDKLGQEGQEGKSPLKLTLGVLKDLAGKKEAEKMTQYAAGLDLLRENEEKYKLHRFRDEVKAVASSLNEHARKSNRKSDRSFWGDLATFIR